MSICNCPRPFHFPSVLAPKRFITGRDNSSTHFGPFRHQNPYVLQVAIPVFTSYCGINKQAYPAVKYGITYCRIFGCGDQENNSLIPQPGAGKTPARSRAHSSGSGRNPLLFRLREIILSCRISAAYRLQMSWPTASSWFSTKPNRRCTTGSGQALQAFKKGRLGLDCPKMELRQEATEVLTIRVYDVKAWEAIRNRGTHARPRRRTCFRNG